MKVRTIQQISMFKEQKYLKHYIHQNFPFALQSRVNPHFHIQGDVQGALKGDNHTGFPLPDIHNKVLPLTPILNPIIKNETKNKIY